jgi:hypothetical protein
VASQSIPVEARAGRGVIVRAAVEAQPPGAHEALRLYVAARDAEHVEPAEVARASLARMTANAAEVQAMLAQKRRERDVIWVLCLNDRLSQIHAALATAGVRRSSLLAAIEARDAREIGHQLAAFQALRLRAEQLLTESRQCV